MLLALNVLRTASALEAAARRAFRPYGVSPAQFNVLNIVSDHADGIASTIVASQLLVDRSNITGLVKGLTKLGLLEVQASAIDGRVKLLRLTRKGRAKWEQANSVYQAGMAKIAAAMGGSEKTVQAGLIKMEQEADVLFR